MAKLRLSSRTHDGTVTVTVAGELDIATTPDLKSCLHKVLLAGAGQVIIDFSGVSLIDAAGLGALVTLRHRAERQHTALLLAGVPAGMLRLMKLTDLDSHFDYLPVAAGHGAGADRQPRGEAATAYAAGLRPGPRRRGRIFPHQRG